MASGRQEWMQSILADAIHRSVRAATGSDPSGELRIGVAFSGGADSTGLLFGLRSLMDSAYPDWTGVALYVNHNLRSGADLDLEELLLLRSCLQLDFPLRICQGFFGKALRSPDHEAPAVNEGSARTYRYSLLQRLREEYQLDFILTGHHLRDQTEGYLLNLLAGSSLRAAIPPVRLPFLRPFLQLEPALIRSTLAAARISWSEDRSNADESIPRNWIRNVLEPQVEKRFPGFANRLHSQIQLEEITRDFARRTVASLPWRVLRPGVVEMSRGEFESLHPFLRLHSLWHAKELCRHVLDETGSQVYLPRKSRMYRWSFHSLESFLQGDLPARRRVQIGDIVFDLTESALLVQAQLVLSTKTGYLFRIRDRSKIVLPRYLVAGRDIKEQEAGKDWVPVHLHTRPGPVFLRNIRTKTDRKVVRSILRSSGWMAKNTEPSEVSLSILECDKEIKAVMFLSPSKVEQIEIVENPESKQMGPKYAYCWVRGY